jgi:protease-4
VATSTGKTKEDVEALFNAGVFKVEDLKEGGWITGIKYVDEVSILRICVQVPGISSKQLL